jgi:hypothetical protein
MHRGRVRVAGEIMKVLKRMKLMKGGRQTLTWPGFAGLGL